MYCSKQDTSGFLLSLLFGLGPLFGGVILISFALAFQFQQPLLTGLSSGIALVLALWRPLQLVSSFKMGLLSTLLLLALSSSIFFYATTSICKLASRKKTSAGNLTSSPVAITIVSLQAFLACGSIALHALAEGLALGVAAPKAYGLGRHMILPVSLHGLPRGAAVASCIYGATDSWRLALAVATFTGFAGPISAISAILAGIDYTGLDVWMVIACGSLIPCFGSILRRSLKLDARRSLYGLVMGLLFASGCLMSTRLVCLHTPYCNSAPEAVT